ncbi:hypothetical protein CQW29_10335 [Pantoea coffeiphila]|uniref:Uncharacterized protein n=1 Tax=Pantoea coffeiphila TaxID=1465635 RepID=A0A2S9IC76_9GAMM|nr:hypothetical protein CQW29_10335 [Pantoea coffeiphila]
MQPAYLDWRAGIMTRSGAAMKTAGSLFAVMPGVEAENSNELFAVPIRFSAWEINFFKLPH